MLGLIINLQKTLMLIYWLHDGLCRNYQIRQQSSRNDEFGEIDSEQDVRGVVQCNLVVDSFVVFQGSIRISYSVSSLPIKCI